jgi:hypothetical protein
MKVQQGNQLFAAAAAVALLTAPAAFAATAVRSPLFVAGKTWNGGFAGPLNATAGGKAVAARSFDAPARDGYAGPVAPKAAVAVQSGKAATIARAGSAARYADFSATRSYAN